ncbi:MAG: hypothetical protein GW874_01675, partial [Solirubrobacter sp.]|nr:hypothetical protein [Solirubrobacter sp.]
MARYLFSRLKTSSESAPASAETTRSSTNLFYAEGLKRLKQEYTAHPSGRGFTNKHSDLIDDIIKALAEKALGEAGLKSGATENIAVIALGSYGRRELCPFSDIDLMVLHRMKDKTTLKRIAEGIFYPLWDL